jgi:cysteinyl-tRNA synthetase
MTAASEHPNQPTSPHSPEAADPAAAHAAAPAFTPFRPYHTGLRKQVDFIPLDNRPVRPDLPLGHPYRPNVRIYNCGPTVYGVPHIGNYRSFLFADVLRRYLEWKGYNVLQVMNITDVGHLTEDDAADASGDDKLQAKAAELGWDPFKVARHFEDLFHAGRKALGIKDAHHYPRATEHVPDMLAVIQTLIDRGLAYVTEAGEVYYRVKQFPQYGLLSGKKLDENKAGARVEINEVKESPEDFALWKTDAKHLMKWNPTADATWVEWEKATGRTRPSMRDAAGRALKTGFPGWHIECSAMSARYLGETFDIHTGGEDNIFPHHECEIAQSVGAMPPGLAYDLRSADPGMRPFVRYWMHARHLLVNNKKMSKREGTLYTLEDLTKPKSEGGLGYTAAEVRYALIRDRYRQPTNFTTSGLTQSAASLDKLMRDARLAAKVNKRNIKKVEIHIDDDLRPVSIEELSFYNEWYDKEVGWAESAFAVAMDDDLNTAVALGVLFKLLSGTIELMSAAAASRMQSMLDVLIDYPLAVASKSSAEEVPSTVFSLIEVGAPDTETLLADPRPMKVSADTWTLIERRHQAKQAKDFALADRIRDHLKAKGWLLEDTKTGAILRHAR